MADYVGAIDQGTTSTRFIVFDRHGAIVAMAQREHAQIYPAPGLVEHDAAEISRNTLAVIQEALERKGAPLHNALVWQDTRVEDLVARFGEDGGKDRLRAATGLPLASYFSGLKLHWLLTHVRGAREKAEAGDALFGTIDAWLVWNLTGGAHGGLHVTDVTNASRTQLMNIATLAWDTDILRLFDIPRACLPRIVSSSEVYGEAMGSLAGLPIAGILGDQQAALVGQVCFT